MPAFPSLEFEQVYHASGWASIVVNVMVAEYFIVQRTLQPLLRRKQRPPPRPLPRLRPHWVAEAAGTSYDHCLASRKL
ncbi:hypothetical protein APR04_005677 [Promicromonospora umidemergens]|nr:hypothetical protein [Promicromonospora umidemergens]